MSLMRFASQAAMPTTSPAALKLSSVGSSSIQPRVLTASGPPGVRAFSRNRNVMRASKRRVVLVAASSRIRQEAAKREAQQDAKMRAQAAARQANSPRAGSRVADRLGAFQYNPDQGRSTQDLEAEIRTQVAHKEAERDAKLAAQGAARRSQTYGAVNRGSGLESIIKADATQRQVDQDAKFKAQAAARQGGSSREARLATGRRAPAAASYGAPASSPSAYQPRSDVQAGATRRAAQQEAKMKAQAAARQSNARGRSAPYGAVSGGSGLESIIKADAAQRQADQDAKFRAQAAARQGGASGRGAARYSAPPRGGNNRGPDMEAKIRAEIAKKEATREAKIRAQAAARQGSGYF